MSTTFLKSLWYKMYQGLYFYCFNKIDLKNVRYIVNIEFIGNINNVNQNIA